MASIDSYTLDRCIEVVEGFKRFKGAKPIEDIISDLEGLRGVTGLPNRMGGYHEGCVTYKGEKMMGTLGIGENEKIRVFYDGYGWRLLDFSFGQ